MHEQKRARVQVHECLPTHGRVYLCAQADLAGRQNRDRCTKTRRLPGIFYHRLEGTTLCPVIAANERDAATFLGFLETGQGEGNRRSDLFRRTISMRGLEPRSGRRPYLRASKRTTDPCALLPNAVPNKGSEWKRGTKVCQDPRATSLNSRHATSVILDGF